VILGLPIRDNITLPILRRISRASFIDTRQEKSICARLIRELSIKLNSAMQPVKSLSGGNQQKVVLAKILATECDILIIDEPTRGIDVGAKYEIYDLILKLAEEGKCVIMVSSEMPELIGICDRILVMSGGRMAGVVERGVDFGGVAGEQETILTLAAKYV
jgi:ribose transport system ATP-binding protein